MTGFGFGSGQANGTGVGTEFLSMLSPGADLDGYDNTKPHNQQKAAVPQIFRDAMYVREEVYGEQGVPLEAEFDEDDARSWHWVVYASVASTASSLPREFKSTSPTIMSKAEEARRASATASRLPVGTLRLIPPPHRPNKYISTAVPKEGDKHPDADPPPSLEVDVSAHMKHPTEPYVKLGRLAVLAPYRKLGLAKLLVNSALEWASKHPDVIYYPPNPKIMEIANQLGQSAQVAVVWNGLVMIHAQAQIAGWWQKNFGFAEELVNEKGEVEISKEERWMEEGIEHVGMWKKVTLENKKL